MPDVRELRDHSPPPGEQVQFRFSDRGVRLKPLVKPQGKDMERQNADAGEDMDIDETLELVWRQFVPEIMFKAPNKRTVAEGTHTHMSMEERLNSTTALFKTFNMAGIFERIQFRVIDALDWIALFDRLFPTGFNVSEGKKQNYNSCLYFKTWQNAMARLSRPHVRLVRSEVLQHFNKLWWLPYAEQGRIWRTDVVCRPWTELPGFSGTPVVHIAFNERFFRGPQAILLRRIPKTMHPLAEEEEEEEDE
ncbi:hypothetical protein JAAARDRAFT_142536 [Jaapia argillacea MUCL 33604]|uniref:Uncharacterized protein n=1 Tax=Jaapia argillacea MUCL 33604 TaxID=933084 RepID=A0A067P5L5_9AGAM|nr:hypothetical protein JAAARDRAFT_142536 [Jaapia argillacea MUCL 33604]